MNRLPELQSSTPVWIWDGLHQQGPMPFQEAWQLQGRGLLPRPGYFWVPGMEGWTPIEQMPPPPEDPGASATLVRQPRVLVVDDDILTCELISELIQENKLGVLTAPGVKSAQNHLSEHGLESFDAVLTDFEMQDGTGVELVRWVKQQDRALQVILLTAKDNKEVVKLGLRAGILDFLEKPVRRTALMNALDHAICQTARQREERAAFLEMVRQRLVGRGILAEKVVTELAHRGEGLTTLLHKLDAISRYAGRLESGDEATAPFSGTLGDLGVTDILQMLIQSHKSGELRLALADRSHLGSIFLDNGNIVHAIDSRSEGPDALRELIQCVRGVFSFASSGPPPRRTIQGGGISALLQASSEIDTGRPLAAA